MFSSLCHLHSVQLLCPYPFFIVYPCWFNYVCIYASVHVVHLFLVILFFQDKFQVNIYLEMYNVVIFFSCTISNIFSYSFSPCPSFLLSFHPSSLTAATSTPSSLSLPPLTSNPPALPFLEANDEGRVGIVAYCISRSAVGQWVRIPVHHVWISAESCLTHPFIHLLPPIPSTRSCLHCWGDVSSAGFPFHASKQTANHCRSTSKNALDSSRFLMWVRSNNST